jgi:serine O-acetyltransferase
MPQLQCDKDTAAALIESYARLGPNLPSRAEVAVLAKDVMDVMFPGFFEGCGGCKDRLAAWVPARLAHLRTTLAAAATLCFAHSAGDGDGKGTANGGNIHGGEGGGGDNVGVGGGVESSCVDSSPAARARAASDALIAALPELRRTVGTDIAAALAGDPAARSVEEIVLSYPSVLAVTLQRMAHLLYTSGVPLLPRMITEHAHERTGIDIHPGAQIGPSFFIDHGTGVVIGETAVIGSHCKLYQGVTLGAKSVSRAISERDRTRAATTKRHPTLEDNVTVYAGAMILGGDVVIGRGSVIGGNVWCLQSVPSGTVVTYTAAALSIRRVEAQPGDDWSI